MSAGFFVGWVVLSANGGRSLVRRGRRQVYPPFASKQNVIPEGRFSASSVTPARCQSLVIGGTTHPTGFASSVRKLLD
jgi:hypothetical protein